MQAVGKENAGYVQAFRRLCAGIWQADLEF
jgi:hypothetical protein